MAWQEKLSLPFFDSPASLASSKQWKHYLKSVYGRSISNQSFFPIDMSAMWFFYGDLLTNSGIVLSVSSFPEHEYARHKCWLNGVRPDAVLMYHPPPYFGAPSNSTIEVTHKGGEGRAQWEKRGYWMYGMPGSGIFYNVCPITVP